MMIPLPPMPVADAPDEEGSKGQIRQANEALILAAAERVFAGAGFGGATMAAIAEASGLPKANLHYYFGSKQALYRGVLARTMTDWLLPIHGITPEAEPRQAIEHYIRAKMALSAQRPLLRACLPTSCCTARRCWENCWRPNWAARCAKKRR